MAAWCNNHESSGTGKHYGGKGGTGWQPGLGNKCGIVWYLDDYDDRDLPRYNAPGGVAGWWHCTL